MTRDDTAKLIPIMQAFVGGAEIQNDCLGSWNEAIPRWDFLNTNYRIKKTPRTFWVYPKEVEQKCSRPIIDYRPYDIAGWIKVQEVIE